MGRTLQNSEWFPTTSGAAMAYVTLTTRRKSGAHKIAAAEMAFAMYVKFLLARVVSVQWMAWTERTPSMCSAVAESSPCLCSWRSPPPFHAHQTAFQPLQWMQTPPRQLSEGPLSPINPSFQYCSQRVNLHSNQQWLLHNSFPKEQV